MEYVVRAIHGVKTVPMFLKRKSLVKMTLSLCAVAALCRMQSASAEPLDPVHNRIKLLELSIDATEKPVGEVINCSTTEIEQGVVHPMVLFSSKVHEEFRFVRPGDPMAVNLNAAWLIRPDKCSALGELNGVGFENYNAEDGSATVYLAVFKDVPIDREIWDKGTQAQLLRILFFPQFRAIKKYRFAANCQPSPQGWLDKLKGAAPAELVCQLTQSRGFLRFEIRPLD